MLDLKQYLSGGLAGIAEVVCTHPIDNLKIKHQEHKLLGSSMNGNQSIWIKENFQIRELYRGLIPRLAGIIPMRFVYWGSQSGFNTYLSNPDFNMGNSKYFYAGALAGSCQTLIDNPIEVLKVRMITGQRSNFLSTLKQSFKFGFRETLIRNAGFCAVFNYGLQVSQPKTLEQKLYYGGISGLTAGILTQPLDVLKTERQRTGGSQSSTLNVVTKIYKNNGLKGFWTGGMMRAALSFSTMGIGSLAFLTLNEYFTNKL